jgi:hypothetical protein
MRAHRRFGVTALVLTVLAPLLGEAGKAEAGLIAAYDNTG